jgi:hypothetical protein
MWSAISKQGEPGCEHPADGDDGEAPFESVGRYERLFQPIPPTYVAQFTERVPMVKARVDKKAATATGYGSKIGRAHKVGLDSTREENP